MADIKFTAGKEYPEIVRAKPDERVVRLLYELRSGLESELTATLQYIYQHQVLSQCNKEVAYILEKISLVEMHHIELLGEAIIAFGGKPCYINSEGCDYNSSSVAYYTDLKSILQKDIEDEQNAVRAYRNTAQLVDNESLQALLYTIADDECVHIKILSALLDDMDVYKSYM